MDGNTTYDISNIQLHHETTKLYENKHYKSLNLYELIKFGIREDNYHYVNYLIFKRLTYIKTLIELKTKRFGFLLLNIDMDKSLIYGQKLTEKQYTNKLIYYANRIEGEGSLSVNIEDLIEEAYIHQDWVMMWYLYNDEKQKIIDFARQEDEKYQESLKAKNRKFFIIQA